MLNKIISLIMAGIFCFANVTGWADQASDSALAPAVSTQQPEFQKRFSAAASLLSENAAHAYIRKMMEKSGVMPEPYIFNGEEVLFAIIPELLVNTGQFAHVGLGRYYGRPVIYIDSEVQNYEADRDIVLRHEIETVRRFEKIRRMLSQAADSEIMAGEMKARVLKYLDSPDPGLANTEYAGRAYREIEKEIHAKAGSLDEVYKKYARKIKIRPEYIAGLLSLYGEDPSDIYNDPETGGSINIAAGSGEEISGKKPSVQDTNTKGGLGAYFGDKLEGLAAINDISKKPNGKSWVADNAPDLMGKFIVTLSMEGNIPEAGDDAGSGAEYNRPNEEGFTAIGIQPGYSHVMHDDKKVKTDYKHLIKTGALKPVFVGDDSIKVRAWGEDPDALTPDEAENDPNNPLVKVAVYKINRGGTWNYILMSEVLDVLYPDKRLYRGNEEEKNMKGKRHRFTQEVVFGKAAFELIKRLDRKPDILHMNEAHTVVAAMLMRADKSYDNTAIVYTNHTLVPSGLETFAIGDLKTDVSRMTYVLGLPDSEKKKKEFDKFRSIFVKTDRQGHVFVDFCYAAFKLADVINAVSDEHARATVKLFRMMYGDEFNKPVIGVLNGSGESWKSSALREWQAEASPITEEEIWSEKLWNIQEENKDEAFKEIGNRTGISLDPKKPTFWAVRRLVDYKSQYPMLKFLVHLMTADRSVSFTRDELMEKWFRDISNLKEDYERNNFDTKAIVDTILDKIFKYGARKTVNGLGAQIVVGWPPPAYEEFWASEFKRWEKLPDLAGRFVAVVSDAKFLKMQGTSSDVTINMPRPLEEACGTSDQRTGLSGGTNIAIRGAGPVEWMEDYDEATGKGSGFFIGSYVNETSDGLEADVRKFYREAPADIFEKAEIASRMFYKDDKKEWRRLMLNSYSRANKVVTARAMEERYARDVYVPAIRARQNTRIIAEVALRDYGDKEHDLSALKAAQKELPFMAEAGVKYVYLPGLMENNGNPLEILDPKNIDGRAGSIADLKEFIGAAHHPRQGLNVVMDWFANQHVAKESEICQKYPERFLYTNISDGNYGLDREARVYQGSALPPDELRRRIASGKKLNKKISSMEISELAEEGLIEIDGRTIHYKLGDENIREKVAGAKTAYRPVIVSDEDALFLVSATDLVSLKDKSPRRWSSLAQPDPSNPDVIREAIETGRHWLKMGLDGFRIDTAPATFPDTIKKNWGINVPVNLIATFVTEMRKIKPDCYFMVGGFERRQELLAFADNRDCSAYSQEYRNYVTGALTDYHQTPALISYLRDLENAPYEANENLIHLGPEHDAFNFKDAWSDLNYQDSNIFYFIYAFLPGYKLVFNSEIHGTRHYYNNEAAKTSPPLRSEEADSIIREIRRRLFSLPRQYRQLLDGKYHYLETGAPWHAIGVARFDDDTIMIGAFNTTLNSGWATFDLKRIINLQIDPLEIGTMEYLKESIQLSGDGKTWITISSKKMKASDLFYNGFGVNVGPKGCEVIRLKKLRVNSDAAALSEEPVKFVGKGSPAKALRSLWGADEGSRIFRKSAVTVEAFAKMRGYSLTTARSELKILIALGLVGAEKRGDANFYYLSDHLAMASPQEAGRAIRDIAGFLETGLDIEDPALIPEKKMPLVRARIRMILDSMSATVETLGPNSQTALGNNPADMKPDTILAIHHDLLNYKSFSREDRVNNNHVAVSLTGALEAIDFEGFKDIFVKMMKATKHSAELETGNLSTILFDIARAYPKYRETMTGYVTEIALEPSGDIDWDLKYDAVKILRGMQVGEVAIASLEAKGISGIGGLALYIKDISSAYIDLGLDTTLFTWLFAGNEDGRRAMEETIHNAGLKYTGKSTTVSFHGEDGSAWHDINRARIYTTMLGDKVRTYAMTNDKYCDVIYGGKTAEDLARRYRFFALSFLEAVRTSNVYPSVLQTNEGVTGFTELYLALPDYIYLSGDPHLSDRKTVLHVAHNLNIYYTNRIMVDNQEHKDYLMRIVGLDPWNPAHRSLISAETGSTEISPTFAAFNLASDGATVSPLYSVYGAENSRSIGTGDVLKQKYDEGRFSGIQNGIDTVSWQHKLLRGKSFFDLKDHDARRDLFGRALSLKKERKLELQKSLGLEINPDVCLYTMLHRLCEQKGYEAAIPAMWEMLKSHPDIQIAVGGQADDFGQGKLFKDELDRIASVYPKRFKYVPGLQYNPRLYEDMYIGADIFLMPSKYEPAGLSQLEAMAAGAPVVARDVEGLATSVTDVEEAEIKGIPATGFKFVDFNPAEIQKAMTKALEAFKQRNVIQEGKDESLWDELRYNCFTHDSRWIQPAKEYINKIFGKNAGVDIAKIADTTELLLIFNEAESNEKNWASWGSADSLNKRLIQHGYNGRRGLNHVTEDAVEELKKIVDDTAENRPLVRQLAKKYYDKYSGLPASAPSLNDSRAVEEGVGRVLSLFSELAAKFDEGVTYEIRYDEKRLAALPHSTEILDAYKRLIAMRMGRENRVKLIPSSGKEGLISVKCYKGEELTGEGAVNINGQVDLAAYPARLTALLNMAFAEAHIRKDITYDLMDDRERSLLIFIKSECKSITGIDVPEDQVLRFIKDLPKTEPLPLDSIEEYNRLTVRKLQQSV